MSVGHQWMFDLVMLSLNNFVCSQDDTSISMYRRQQRRISAHLEALSHMSSNRLTLDICGIFRG